VKRIGFVVYLVAMICSAVVISLRFVDGFPLETNILALLPETEEVEWVQRAETLQQTKGSNQLVALVSNADFDVAKEAAEILQKKLIEDKIIDASKSLGQDGQIQSVWQTLFPYRTGLLSEADRRLLNAGEGQKIIDRARAQIFSPLSMAGSDLIREDPFLLFPSFLEATTALAPNLQLRQGVLAREENGRWNVLVAGELLGAPFDKAFQSKTLTTFNGARDRLLATYPGTEILKTGAVFYGEKAYRQAEPEAGFIGGISLIGIIILNILVFRSLQPLLLSLLAISSGIIGGLAITLLFFGKLHLLALVFGAGLIGIAVDYAFHYFCERFQENAPPPSARAKAIRAGLTLGLVSSVLGFLTLSLTPFPGLQQIALFSASGLTMAFLTVLYVFPLIDRTTRFPKNTGLLKGAMGLYEFWWSPTTRRLRIAATAALVIIGAMGAAKITIDDDVRRLQSLPADLQSEERQIRTITGIESDSYKFLIRGTTHDEALRFEEAVTRELDRLIAAGSLKGYQAISRFIPSKVRQIENRELVKDKLFPLLAEHLRDIGLDNSMPYGPELNVLTPELLADKKTPDFLSRLLVYNSPGVIIHAVTLSGVSDSRALFTLADKSENVVLVSQAEGLSATFGSYRFKSLIMLAIAYGVVWVFLSLRYGIFGSIQAMIPSIGAVLLAPCLLALLGEAFTFFNAMSLILVFAIGLDYALFNRESEGPKKQRATLANGLSALSTILAFGLLSLSDTYAIHAFGITILVGIVLAYFLAPLAADINHKEPERL
jgi:predicted exporter